MKPWLIGALVMALVATSAPTPADAKRLSGGKSSGLQRNMPARTAPDAPPPKPATPAQGQQAAPANAATAAPAAAAAAPKRNWMGPLAGLAAGLGIAALLSHFGLGEGFANIVMMLLLAAGAFLLVRFLMARFGKGAGPALATAGAGSANRSGAQVAWPTPAAPQPAQSPMERTSFESAPAAAAAAATPLASPAGAEPVAAAFVPASFDTEAFTRTAKIIVIRMQAANDTADLDDLRKFTTPELFASLRLDIQERGSSGQVTDVQKVEAEVLDVANEADRQVVSVRFHGQVVEEKGAAPVDFNEVWHLVKPHDDSRPWAIAGIEQLA